MVKLVRFDFSHCLLALSVVAFCYSLTLPAFVTEQRYLIESRYYGPGSTYYGYKVLIFGWAGVLVGSFGWLANPLYLLSIVFVIRRKPISCFLLCVALALAISSLIFKNIGTSGTSNEYIKYFLKGFWCWLVSLLLMFMASILATTTTLKYESS